jgi:DNA-binding transcriptional ArsR family regulator
VDIATLIHQEQAPALQGRLTGGDPTEMPEAPAAESPVAELPVAELPVAESPVAERPDSGAEAAELAALLRILADPTRLRLLTELVDGERSVTDLCRRMATPQPSVSHHLAWLRASNLVVFRRDGKRVLYALGPAMCFDGNALRVGAVRIGLNARGNA